MKRAPGFTTAAVATLALGLGLNSAVLSLAFALFLKPLPVPEPLQVVLVDQTHATRVDRPAFPLSYPDYTYYRDHVRTLAGLAAHYPTSPMHVSTSDQGFDVTGSVVTASYFTVLRIQPAIGRFFSAEEDLVPRSNPVAVLSHTLWRQRFNADERILGSEVRINGTAFTVVGIAPAGFEGVIRGVTPSDVWIPTAMFNAGYRYCDGLARGCAVVNLIGRLKPGVGIADAQTEMTVLARQLEIAFPKTNEGRGVLVRPARGLRADEQYRNGPIVVLLAAAATLVLLVASANVAGLLLARGLDRRREIAIRRAVGAGRAALIRQLVAEAIVLSMAGGMAGLIVALWTTELLRGFFGFGYQGSALNIDLSLDWRVAAAGLVVALVTGLFTGIVPAFQATRPDPLPALKDEGFGGSAHRSLLRDGLIVIQLAVSVVLLTGSSLLVRSFLTVHRGPGFDPDAVALVRLRPSLLGYTGERAWAFQSDVLRAVEALPGVIAASPAGVPPLPGWGRAPTPLQLAGDTSDPERAFQAPTTPVGARYFEALGVDLVEGREFDDRDHADSSRVAIVNEALAHRLWPAGGAVGSVVTIGGMATEVVGVVKDAQFLSVLEQPEPIAYLNYWQQDVARSLAHDSFTHVRVAGDAAAMLPAIRRTIAAIDPDVPVTDAHGLGARLNYAFAAVRAVRTLLVTFAALTLVVSGIGLYAGLAFAVGRGTREIAIRTALGAARTDIVRLVLRRGGMMVAIGVTIGLLGAVAAGPVLGHLLYGVSPLDPLALLSAPLILMAGGVLAMWLPARRAMAVDTMKALRLE